ncbi:hypothetical protein O6H91_11G024800 [Diphasiastrum complanatum]|uniref:Uncharacterized protein n=1 Tax=Diphasiastrum complanatum TaxID=34168 RepID=A0ACC2C8A0_DIPCM|nr:hypothetical protein O6H91_11G024800 [Diphasiastrum complanatum]
MTSRRTSTTIPSACLPCISLGLYLLSCMRSFPDFIVTAATPSCSLSKENCRELTALNLNLNISFSSTAKASQDFGHMYHDRPSAILYASSAQDIVATVKLAYFSPNHLSWKMESHTLEDVNSNVTIESDAPVLYCMELTKAYFERKSNLIGKKLNSLLELLHYLPSEISIIDASYLGFLDRVHDK